jgi:hypothetical protein
LTKDHDPSIGSVERNARKGSDYDPEAEATAPTVAGQIKTFAMFADGGNMVIEVANAGWIVDGAPTWSSGTTYAIGDIIIYDSKPYVSLQNSNTNNTPNTSPSFWALRGTITFTAQGNACTLQYINNRWFCIGNNGATFT